jgi:hypothetical protein
MGPGVQIPSPTIIYFRHVVQKDNKLGNCEEFV